MRKKQIEAQWKQHKQEIIETGMPKRFPKATLLKELRRGR